MSNCSATNGGPVILNDIVAIQNDDVRITYSTVTIDGSDLDLSSTLELYLLDQADGVTNFTLVGTQGQDLSQWSFVFNATDNTSVTTYDYTMRLTVGGERVTLAVGKIFINSDL